MISSLKFLPLSSRFSLFSLFSLLSLSLLSLFSLSLQEAQAVAPGFGQRAIVAREGFTLRVRREGGERKKGGRKGIYSSDEFVSSLCLCLPRSFSLSLSHFFFFLFLIFFWSPNPPLPQSPSYFSFFPSTGCRGNGH